MPRFSRRSLGRWFAFSVAAAGIPAAARVRAQEASPVASPVAGTPAASPVASPVAVPVAAAPPDPNAPEFGPVQANAPYRFALLVPYPNAPFWQSIQQAAIERGTADGAAVDAIPLDNFSVPRQIEQIEAAIAAGYSGILLGAIDAAGVAPGIISATTAGVPVLALDIEPAGGELVSLVRTGDVAAATLAAQALVAVMGGQGTVLDLQGNLDHPVGQARDAGFRAGFADFPGVTIVAATANWNRFAARSATQEHLAPPATPTPASPEAGDEGADDLVAVDAVFAANDQMTLGALDAIQENGSREIVVGFGESPEILDAVRAGALTAAIAEQPRRMGMIAVDLMVRHLNGESVPPRVDSGAAVVTTGNVDLVVA